MKPNIFWLMFCVVALVAGRKVAGLRADSSAAPIRIGVFQARAVALAYWRSDAGLKEINDLVSKAKAARQNGGDTTQLRALENQCQAMQDHVMAEAFGNAPIDDVMRKLQNVLPDVAQQNNVVAIVPQVAFKAEGVETVDVTDQLSMTFKPTPRTCSMMRDLVTHPCVPLKIAGAN